MKGEYRGIFGLITNISVGISNDNYMLLSVKLQYNFGITSLKYTTFEHVQTCDGLYRFKELSVNDM
jgi:hypothetical protein